MVGLPKDILADHWRKSGLLIVIGAIGATTRLVAPLIKNKENDPAVLVIDAKGSQVVPLLGTHSAGAEELGMQLAEDLGGKVVLTGDAFTQDRLAIDSFGEAWGWKRTGKKILWNQLLYKQSQGIKAKLHQYSGTRLWQIAEAATDCFTKDSNLSDSSQLIIGPQDTKECSWHPATLWVGIGCERNTSKSLIERSLKDFLKDSSLSRDAIAGLASVDLKSDEPALLSLAKISSWPIRFFSVKELSEVKVPHPSLIVEAEIGTPSVAEAAALLGSGEGGTLLKSKKIYHAKNNELGAVTIAIAEALKPFAPSKGELHLVGSGPGDLSFLTNDARRGLSRSVVWVGYGLYLDLLEPLRRVDQVRIDSHLTLEQDRCIKAIELATQGIRVALISSGDCGIYGMGGLALELWLEKPINERPELIFHTGISAAQMLASRVGAPLMNDFCVVSLSDKLTPWNTIKDRLRGASLGDFVLALYNPKSKDRDWQLQYTIQLLLEYRSPDTPVAIARQLGRKDEKIQLKTLGTLPISEVDMLTVILIGNSHSLVRDNWMVTPRGYQNKLR